MITMIIIVTITTLIITNGENNNDDNMWAHRTFPDVVWENLWCP